MYFAIETFAGHPGLPQTCRLEENVLVTKDGPSIFTKMEHMEEAVAGYRPGLRMKTSTDTALSHTGFRCVKTGPSPEEIAKILAAKTEPKS